MKRIIPMILACTMVLGTTAWAETEDAENETVTAAQADEIPPTGSKNCHPPRTKQSPSSS